MQILGDLLFLYIHAKRHIFVIRFSFGVREANPSKFAGIKQCLMAVDDVLFFLLFRQFQPLLHDGSTVFLQSLSLC